MIGSANDVDYANDGHDVAIVLKQGNGGVWSRVVALQTPIPGGVGNFFAFAAPAIRDGVVVFLGGRDNPFALPLQAGIHTDAFGDVVPIVDLATPFGHADPRSFTVADGGRWWQRRRVRGGGQRLARAPARDTGARAGCRPRRRGARRARPPGAPAARVLALKR